MESSSSLCFPMPMASRSCPKCFRIYPQNTGYCVQCRDSTCSAICSVESRRGAYIGILRDATLGSLGLWSNMAKKSVNQIAECITDAHATSNEHNCNGLAHGCPLKLAFWCLKREVDELVTGVRGLCLDCIKAERETTSLNMPDSDAKACRVNHIN